MDRNRERVQVFARGRLKGKLLFLVIFYACDMKSREEFISQIVSFNIGTNIERIEIDVGWKALGVTSIRDLRTCRIVVRIDMK